jgi:hypothetical protein
MAIFSLKNLSVGRATGLLKNLKRRKAKKKGYFFSRGQ